MSRFFACATLVVLCLIPQFVTAELITYSSSFGPQTFSLGTRSGGSIGSSSPTTLNWDASLGLDFIFPQFDPSLGQLQGIQFTFAGASGLTADILFVNNQPSPFDIAGINVNMTTNLSFQDATLTASSTASNFVTNTVTATSSTTPFNFNVGSDILVGTTGEVTSSQFSSYVGNGTVTLPMSIQFLAEATTSNGIFAVTPFPSIVLNPVQVTYSYSAVPEPSGLMLTTMALATLAFKRRTRAVQTTK